MQDLSADLGVKAYPITGCPSPVPVTLVDGRGFEPVIANKPIRLVRPYFDMEVIQVQHTVYKRSGLERMVNNESRIMRHYLENQWVADTLFLSEATAAFLEEDVNYGAILAALGDAKADYRALSKPTPLDLHQLTGTQTLYLRLHGTIDYYNRKANKRAELYVMLFDEDTKKLVFGEKMVMACDPRNEEALFEVLYFVQTRIAEAMQRGQ